MQCNSACCEPVLQSSTEQQGSYYALTSTARLWCCITALQHWSGQNTLLFSAALQNRLTVCFCHCSHTYAGLPFTRVCSDATSKHCSTGQSKIAALLFSAALQNRLTACLCHCSQTSAGLLFSQVFSDATPKHCSTGQCKLASLLLSASLQNRLTAC